MSVFSAAGSMLDACRAKATSLGIASADDCEAGGARTPPSAPYGGTASEGNGTKAEGTKAEGTKAEGTEGDGTRTEGTMRGEATTGASATGRDAVERFLGGEDVSTMEVITATRLDPEAFLVALVRHSGGQILQEELVAVTDWSRSTVSRKLCRLEDQKRVSRIRVGREKLVVLPDRVAAADAAGRVPDRYSNV